MPPPQQSPAQQVPQHLDRDRLVSQVTAASGKALASAARRQAIAGGLVQLAGMGLLVTALLSQLWVIGDDALTEKEFIAVLFAGAVLLLLGPRAARAARVDEQRLKERVEQVTTESLADAYNKAREEQARVDAKRRQQENARAEAGRT